MAWSSSGNWQVGGASPYSDTGAAAASASSLSVRIAAAATALLRPSKDSASSLVTSLFSMACLAFIASTSFIVTPVIGRPAASFWANSISSG